MGKKGILIDIDYCTGCHTCEIACKQENRFQAGTWGIKVTELIFPNPNGHVQIDYIPHFTTMCNLCHARIKKGEDSKPSCVKHCGTGCMYYGEVAELAEKMVSKPRSVLYTIK